jgi:DNA invertase Pin-like site-specific DNA recombinase
MKAYKRRGLQVSVTEEERKEMKELYKNGSTTTEIANRFGRNRNTVYKICNDWHPPKQKEDNSGIFHYSERQFESLFINFSL